MSKKRQTRGRNIRKSSPMMLIFGGLALLALALLATVLARPRSNYSPEVTGGPSLRVDRKQVDLGDIRLGTPVEASFTVTNVGDEPLRFAEQPWIEVKEGC